jgi:prolyl oligopeptidase
MNYPYSRKSDQVDDYHGLQIADPYRWLEDTDSAETQAWIEAQNKLTFSFLEQIPARPVLRQRLAELWNYPRQGVPIKRGGHYFQPRNSGLQNQDALYTFDTLEAAPRLLLDPNLLSADGTVALTGLAVSKDGRHLAYATSSSGSDWLTWHVRKVETGEDLPDRVEWSKFSGAAWLPDGSGFYYGRYAQPEPGKALEGINQNQKLYLHRLGQAQDTLFYERPDQPEWGFSPEVTEDGRYLVLSVWQGTDVRNRVFILDLSHSQAGFIELIHELEAAYTFVENDGPRFYFRTDRDAPRGRLVAIDLDHPDPADWETLIPEAEDVLEQVMLVGGRFVAVTMHDAYHQIRLFSRRGAPLGDIKLPTLGSLAIPTGLGLSGQRGQDELFYAFSSFSHPLAVYRCDLKDGTSQPFFFPTLQFDFSPYETRQVFVTSKDGTRLPMFLVHRRDLVLDGSNPTLLYGYGGFSIALTPSFSVGRLAWLEKGGVLAVANLRGGGEYGEAWHKAGMLDNKQNVFDDFIACAEYLVARKITSPARLAIQGGSNGGLLVGACLTQRPELFGAALPAVGVMDMLRFHRFTIGWAWVSDYGSADDPQQFKTLLAYSPLHNIHPGVRYPATLVTTADHDDRVVPGHSFKFAATLQGAQAGEAPILIRIQTRAGHGFGKPTAILIEEMADMWAFLFAIFDVR